MNAKTNAVIGTVALAALVVTFFQWNRAFRAESELAALTADRDGLRGQLHAEEQRAAQSTAALRRELDELKAKQPAAMPVAPRAAPPVTAAQIIGASTPDYAQLRRASMNQAITNNLRQISAVRDEFQRRNGRPAASLDEVVGEGKFIRALVPVNGEDYSSLSLVPGAPLAVTDSDGTSVTFDPAAAAARAPIGPAEQSARARMNELQPTVAKAAAAFSAAHPGVNPHSPEELLPYFSTPQEGADFVEAVAAMAAARGK